MLEQLKAVRFFLATMSGTAKVEDLRAKVIEQAGAADKKYEDLKPDEQREVDVAVESMQQLAGFFTEIVQAKARMTKSFFVALKHEGFTDDQALLIVAHQVPLETSKGD